MELCDTNQPVEAILTSYFQSKYENSRQAGLVYQIANMVSSNKRSAPGTKGANNDSNGKQN